MLKNKDVKELIDTIINISMEIEMFDTGNSIPPSSWHVQNLKRKGVRYYHAIPGIIDYRVSELLDAIHMLPIDQFTRSFDVYRNEGNVLIAEYFSE